MINSMSHEIEADFVAEWGNEITQCRNCTSFRMEGNSSFCTEAQSEVPFDGHCDFFQSIT